MFQPFDMNYIPSIGRHGYIVFLLIHAVQALAFRRAFEGAPPLYWGWIRVTLSKHFGHLCGMKRAMNRILYGSSRAGNYRVE